MRFRLPTVILLLLCTLQNVRGGVPYYVPRSYAQQLPVRPLVPPEGSVPFWEQRAVHIGFGLVAAGAAVAFADDNIRSIRNGYIPSFRNHYDDFMQFSPAALMLAMKTLGFESRSSWERMLSAAALSSAVMVASTYGIKHGVGRLRPDGSAYNSFPSGHTAMAFTAATMLHIEYGHLSPWISVAGYTLATATGIGRTLNNRHWLSDVVVGAGIGILSTRIGYLVDDAIFGRRWLHGLPDDEFPLLGRGNPSFIGFRLGGSLIPFAPSGTLPTTRGGASVGVEGAWFFSPRVGFGAAFDIDRFAARAGALGGTVADNGAINSMSLKTGLYLSYDLAPRWQAGGKLTVGTTKRQHTERQVVDGAGADVSTLEYDSVWRFTAAAGVSLGFVAARNLRFRLFADMNAVPDGYSVSGRQADVRYGFPLTLGVGVDAMLW